MHKCTFTSDCPGCRAEAAKAISDWGDEGVETAARIVGNDTAQALLQQHVQRNIAEIYPGLTVRGDESGAELHEKIKRHNREQREAGLTDEQRLEVESARATLRQHGLLDE